MLSPGIPSHVTPPSEWPMVSVIVPCRNEERWIAATLHSILQGDYPADRLEVLVVDGCSTDRTGHIVSQIADAHPRIRLVDNPRRTTPAALNRGLEVASGTIIVRMDAHSTYPSGYLRTLVSWLLESGADNVGGMCETVPADSSRVAAGIAVALSHPFGVGNSYFRIGATTPRWVDTVPFGCFHREVFDRVGGFDEELIRNQDDEFNLRLRRYGGRVLLIPQLQVRYYARRTLGQLWCMYYQYGLFKPLVIHKVGGGFAWRQLMPTLFVGSLAVFGVLSWWWPLARVAFLTVVLLYVLANLTVSLRLRVEHGPQPRWALPLAFATIHLAYGVGMVVGFVRLLPWVRRRRKRDLEPSR